MPLSTNLFVPPPASRMDHQRQRRKTPTLRGLSVLRRKDLMQRGDFEVLATTLLKDAGMTSDEPVCVVQLVQRTLGPRALRFAPEGVLPGNGSLVRVGTEWRIYLRKTAPYHLKRFVALHEVAHFVLGTRATEDECDQLAAAVLLPRVAFLREHLDRRRRIHTIAQGYGADETCAWLRLAEVTGQPVAVVSPRRVLSRGASTDHWLRSDEAREIAASPRPKGIRRATLRDDPARVVLRRSS